MARQFFLLKERPTAIAVVNDYVALAFMVEVMRAGIRVPEELSIIGLDNQPIAFYCPVPLTTMTQPIDKIVHAVEAMIRDRTNAAVPPDTAPKTVLIKGELVQRSSVAMASS